MDADERSMLHKILDLTEENNKYIRKVYRATQWRKWITVMYWLVIIALSFGAYYLIQPYLDTLGEAYEGIRSQVFGAPEKGSKIIQTLSGGGETVE